MNSKGDSENNTMNTWLEEVSNYLRYYYSIDKASLIEKIYVYGANCHIEEIVQFLSMNLNFNIEIVRKISNIDIKEAIKINFEISKCLIPSLALFYDKKELNFLTDNYEHHKFVIKTCGAFITATFLLLLILLYYALYNSKNNFKLENEIYEMQLYINNDENINANLEIEILKNEILFLEDSKDNIEILKMKVSTEDYVCSSILSEILYAKPTNTKVTSISVDRNTTQIQCCSKDMVEVTLFLLNLRKIDFVESLYIPAIEKSQDLTLSYSYSIICKLKDVSSYENK